jgi:N-terminal half of MaoC dehydratase
MGEAAESATSRISDEMRGALGTEIRRAVSFPVSESDIRRWAIATYYPEPAPARFVDPKAAADSASGGMVAPEDFNPFAWAVAEFSGANLSAEAASNPDVFEEGIGIKGPGLKNILNGGMECEYGEPIRPGDVITAVTTLDEYRERPGKLGLMLFTISKTSWVNQHGQIVKTTSGTTIRY